MGDDQNTKTEMNQDTPFQSLTPDRILDAIESLGYWVNGRVTALNSYENRVYQIGIEEGSDLVAKFYRPNRWSDQQILEEHLFIHDLVQQEIPVVPVLERPEAETDEDADQPDTLFEFEGFRFALFPMRSGHPLELDNMEHLESIGRILGQLHACGSRFPFQHRNALTSDIMGWQARTWILESGHLPSDLKPAYETTSEFLLQRIDENLSEFNGKSLRLHGDFHPGNILFRDGNPLLVDLDDCVSGPAIQDIWMLLSGDREQQQIQLKKVLEGYRMFTDFDPSELGLIESMRSLRILNYAAWISRRWNDPAFPQSFPWFTSNRFWSDHILQLKEQLAAMDSLTLPMPQFD